MVMVKIGDYVKCIVNTIASNGFEQDGIYLVVNIQKLNTLHYKYFIRNRAGDEKQNINSGSFSDYFELCAPPEVTGANAVERFDDAMGILK